MSKVPGTGATSPAGAARSSVTAEAVPLPQVATLPLWVLGALAVAALTVMWLVGFDNGQLTGALDSTGSYVHELFHDGRHVLGVPCH